MMMVQVMVSRCVALRIVCHWSVLYHATIGSWSGKATQRNPPDRYHHESFEFQCTTIISITITIITATSACSVWALHYHQHNHHHHTMTISRPRHIHHHHCHHLISRDQISVWTVTSTPPGTLPCDGRFVAVPSYERPSQPLYCFKTEALRAKVTPPSPSSPSPPLHHH